VKDWSGRECCDTWYADEIFMPVCCTDVGLVRCPRWERLVVRPVHDARREGVMRDVLNFAASCECVARQGKERVGRGQWLGVVGVWGTGGD
jgi:hypothetical protein